MKWVDAANVPRPGDAGVRVCVAAASYYPVFSGAALRFRRYLPGLARRGVVPEVLTGTPTAIKARLVGAALPPEKYRRGSPLSDEEVDGFRVVRASLPDTSGHKRTTIFGSALVSYCRRGVPRPDVVQLLSLPAGLAPSIVRLRRLGIPTVLTGTMVGELPEGRLQNHVRRLFVKGPMNLTDCVVASSHAMKAYFLDVGVTVPIEVIANGVDLGRFRPPSSEAERNEVRRRLGIGPSHPLVLFVGSVTPRKGVELLLEAWVRIAPRHPDAYLIIVGPRRDVEDPKHHAFRDRFVRLVAQSGAPDRVRFAGCVNDVEVYMRAADVLVLPSEREGLPNVVLEAMATGVPCVLTPFAGLSSELGLPDRHYLLARPDPPALEAAVSRLLGSPPEARALGRAARERIRATMDVEVTLDRYADLYRRLGSRPRAVSPQESLEERR